MGAHNEKMCLFSLCAPGVYYYGYHCECIIAMDDNILCIYRNVNLY